MHFFEGDQQNLETIMIAEKKISYYTKNSTHPDASEAIQHYTHLILAAKKHNEEINIQP